MQLTTYVGLRLFYLETKNSNVYVLVVVCAYTILTLPATVLTLANVHCILGLNS